MSHSITKYPQPTKSTKRSDRALELLRAIKRSGVARSAGVTHRETVSGHALTSNARRGSRSAGTPMWL